MLYCVENGEKQPCFMGWFGNFFEPYFSSRRAVKDGLQELAELGFNSIVLDSKLWENFLRYFREGIKTPYVEMQDYIIRQAAEVGLGVSFLALYMNGDNLWPVIYDYPPVFVDQPVALDGTKIRGYRHWSKKQLQQQVQHCLDLYDQLAGDNAARALDDCGNLRLPFYLYHDPVFTPSFDEDGRNHYLCWLETQYSPDEINRRYGIQCGSIHELTPDEYWLYPQEGTTRCDVPRQTDYHQNKAAILKYADNQHYRTQVMAEYFQQLTSQLRKAKKEFYLYSCIMQWKYFFNDCEHACYWDMSRRGVDLWDLGQSLDSPSFTTLPADCYAEPNAYVVSAELAMLRSAAECKDFIAGLFMGRYLYRDIYGVVSPEEIIATAFGAGATDLYFYGYNGLDDGGNFGRWEQEKKKSLKQGLETFAQMRKLAGKRRRTYEAAIIFPLATFILQHAGYNWKEYAAYRTDTLGWYMQLADMGVNCDFLHPRYINKEMLQQYRLLILPANPLYWAEPDHQLETMLQEYVRSGGTVFRSASDYLGSAWSIKSEPHAADSVAWIEKVVLDSPSFISFMNGEQMASYMKDARSAIVSHTCGRGTVISFGFDYGYAYASHQHLPVPPEFGRDDHYPLSLLKITPVEVLLKEMGFKHPRHREVEVIPFEKGVLVINHSSVPVELAPFVGDSTKIQYLYPHQAVFI